MSKEAKFQFYQEVTVHSNEAEIDEYCWDCPESELTSTGRQFNREDFYDDNVSIRVNQKGEIVGPDDLAKG